MTRVTDIPVSELKNKPAHGQPCNNCGLCCRAILCDLAQHVFKRNAALHHAGFPNQNPMGPCPAIEHKDGKQLCGLMTNPAKYKPEITEAEAPAYSEATRYLLAAGTGCTARFNGEPADRAFYSQLEEWDRMNWDDVVTAQKLWGLKR